MNYLKENTVGVDNVIKGMQKYLYSNLLTKWSLTDFDAYGRVYKNSRNKRMIPEHYISGNEYSEVLLDDRKDGIMFFSPNSTQEVNGNLITQECDIIFSVNLNSLKGSAERQDEEVRQQVLFLLDVYDTNQKVVKAETGLLNVYRDYNGVAEYFLDMQEFHHFKITLDLRYINTSCK